MTTAIAVVTLAIGLATSAQAGSDTSAPATGSGSLEDDAVSAVFTVLSDDSVVRWTATRRS